MDEFPKGDFDKNRQRGERRMRAGDITLYDVGSANVSIEVNSKLTRALESPLSLYAVQLLLERASFPQQLPNINWAQDDIQRASDLLHQIIELINGRVRVTDDKFQSVRGLASEAYVNAIMHRLGIPYQVSSWVEDWLRFEDFIVDPDGSQPIAVDVTTSVHPDEIVHKIIDHPLVTTLLVPLRPFRARLFGGKFDDKPHIDATTRAMTALSREDPVRLTSLVLERGDLSRIGSSMQDDMQRDSQMRSNMRDSARSLANYNHMLMSVFMRPDTDSTIQLNKHQTERTILLSRRFQKAIAIGG